MHSRSLISAFAICSHLDGKERADCFTLIVFLISSWCFVAVSVLWLFLAVSWVGLQCVIVVFPDLTHLFYLITSLHVLNDLLQCIVILWVSRYALN